ncbi:MAG: endonuclease/exonuclease/phosphatase family protein [Myxococcota bacterium]
MRVLLVAMLASPAAHARPLAGERADFTILSWNVNYGLTGDPAALTVLRDLDADVVLLQESNAAWEAYLRDAALYPHADFLDDGAAGGLAVLSRWPFRHVATTPSPAGWFDAWTVRVETPEGPVQIVQVHLRPPYGNVGGWATGWIDSASVHRAEIAAAWAAVDPALPTLVVGDFNEPRGGALRWLSDRGLRCALHDVSPGALTWRWDLGWITLRNAFDHVVHDPRLAPVEVEVLDRGHSDHLPIRASYAFSP